MTPQPTGWTKVKRNEFIDYDLEKFPLRIKTNSLLGSGDILRVYFYDSKSHYAGAFGIVFHATPQYYIRGCTEHIDFPTKLPSTSDKVWGIALIRSSGTADRQDSDLDSAVKLVVHCNEEEVLSFPLSHSTCSDDGWVTPYVRREVAKMWFFSRDTASDYFMSQSGITCSNIYSTIHSQNLVLIA